MIVELTIKYAIKMFNFIGVKFERNIELEKVKDFIDLLRPVTTEFELIRIGGDNDGGYLIPNDIEGISALFSPGVAQTASFELELANRGIESYLADFSVNHAPVEHANIHFEKIYLGSKTNVEYTTIEDWVMNKDLPLAEDLILQMDIEGSEYETILSAPSELLSRFRIMVIEFHFLDKATTYFGNRMITETFYKLKKCHEIVHIHTNNCCEPVKVKGLIIHPCIEVTFFRRDRFQKSSPTLYFPHSLDQPNIKGKRQQDFTANW
jgi:hypothetical protein